MPLLHAAQHLPAVDPRHHHVEQDEVGRGLLEHLQALLAVAGLADRVALHLEVDAHVLAHPLVVVDDQDDRPSAAAAGRARTGAIEEAVEVAPLVAAVAARRVKGRHAPLVGPLADRALGDAEVLGRLAEGQPVRLAGRGEALRDFVLSHPQTNLPKAFAS